MNENDDTTQADTIEELFSENNVDSKVRELHIRNVFNKVATRYDLMNDAMSFGIHRLWKSRLVKLASPQKDHIVVDLAGGTGDVAIKLSKYCNTVLIVEPSLKMIAVGLKKHSLPYIGAIGESLPFANHSIDTLSISFGIRNVTDMQACLGEIERILKPGGRVLCLEFSKPQWWLKPFYDLYSYWVIPRLGALIAGQPEAYTYLIESIRRFPDQLEMKRMMQASGLINCRYTNLSFGIACIHIGTKK